jgi:putative flippase GtrA
MQKLLDKINELLSRFVPGPIMRYVSSFLTISFITFVIIGAVNTLSTSVIATILDALKTRFVLSGGAADAFFTRTRATFILGYILSMIISFFLNTYFTFHEKPTWKKALRFPVSYIPNFIIQYAVVWVFTSLAWNNTLAYLLAAVIGIPVTFLTMKVFVYKK